MPRRSTSRTTSFQHEHRPANPENDLTDPENEDRAIDENNRGKKKDDSSTRLSDKGHFSNKTHEPKSRETIQCLENHVDELEGAFLEMIGNGTPDDQVAIALSAWQTAMNKLEAYRIRSQEHHPSRRKWDAQNEEQGASRQPWSDDDFLLPRDLPALQIEGSAKWHPSKDSHASTEAFLEAFEAALEASSLDLNKHWQRLLPKCLNNLQSIWLETETSRCSPPATWEQIRVKIVQKYGKGPIPKSNVFRMKQERDRKVSAYMRQFHQRWFESGLHRCHGTLTMALMASLQENKQVFNLVSTKFGSRLLDEPLEDVVDYVSSLEFGQTDTRKRPRESEDRQRPAPRHLKNAHDDDADDVSQSIPAKSDNDNDASIHHRSCKPVQNCKFCNRPYDENHKCNEFRIAKGLAPLPQLPAAGQSNLRNVHIKFPE